MSEEQEHEYWLVVDKEDPKGRFRAVNKPPRWAFLKTAVAAKKGDDESQMVALYELTMALIKRDEHARFDEYMSYDDDMFEKLQEGISTLCEEYTSRPLEESSSSASSSTPTEPTSRVVSFSRGEVEIRPLESPTETEMTSSTA